ncbi:MAG: NAD-binding protein [Pseudomonadota bacterium]
MSAGMPRRSAMSRAMPTSFASSASAKPLSNTTSNKVTQFLLPGRYDSGFALALLKKDVGMARDMAERLGIPADMLGHVSARLRESSDALQPDADHTEVHAWLKVRSAKG